MPLGTRKTTTIVTATIAVAVVAAVAVATTILAAPAAARPASPDHRLLIIGASYTAGWGATDPDLDYAHRLADELGWPTTISAEPGAGYLSPGNDGHSDFEEQLRALPRALDPGLVIIQGGRDDAGRYRTQEYAAIRRTIEAVRARYGRADIVLLGDIPAQLPVDHANRVTNAALARAAASEHVQFVDPIAQHWMTRANLPGFRSNVPGHPDDAGHAYIARRLYADLPASIRNR